MVLESFRETPLGGSRVSMIESVRSLCDEARACIKKRDAKGAISKFLAALEAEPNDVPAHEGLATVYFLIKDYDQAIALFQRVTRLDPTRSQPLTNLGAIYNKKGEYREAVNVLRQALAKDRRCAEAYYNLGIAQRGLNQMSMALSAYKEAIRLQPDMPEAYTNLGNILVEMKNYTQAKLNFQRALEIRPDFEKAKRGLLKADDSSRAAKKSVNPFGRLVGDAELERNASGVSKFRELTPHERYDDRTEVHRLSKDSEQAAAALLTHLREELQPSLLMLHQTVTEEDERRGWAEEQERLDHAMDNFSKLSTQLFRLGKELQSHETFIRGT